VRYADDGSAVSGAGGLYRFSLTLFSPARASLFVYAAGARDGSGCARSILHGP